VYQFVALVSLLFVTLLCSGAAWSGESAAPISELIQSLKKPRELGEGRVAEQIVSFYAPKIWWHSKERYPATDPMSFIQHSSLRVRGLSGREKVLAPFGQVRAQQLAKIENSDFSARPYQTGFVWNGSGYFLRLEDSRQGSRQLSSSESAPILWRLGEGSFADLLSRTVTHSGESLNDSESKRRIILEYWYQMPYNLATRIGIGNHQGDWEGVAILIELSIKDSRLEHRLLAAYFAEHETGTWKCANELLKAEDGIHIEAFSAKGTHATYPAPGSYRNGPLTDEAERGVPWETWHSMRALALEPYYGFSGAWGEPRFFSFMTGPMVPGPGTKALPRDTRQADELKLLALLSAKCGFANATLP
jgi:hypothetical protein